MKSARDIEIREIENSKALIDIFGTWPSFHDSEIYSIFLDRPSPDPVYLEMCIRVFTMKNKDGESVFDKQAMVTLRFNDVELEEIGRFNEQNVIFDFTMIRSEENQIKITISSSYGCSASFTCSQVIVKSTNEIHGT